MLHSYTEIIVGNTDSHRHLSIALPASQTFNLTCILQFKQLVQVFGKPLHNPVHSHLLYLIDTLSLWPPAASSLYPSPWHTPVFESLSHHCRSIAEHQLSAVPLIKRRESKTALNYRCLFTAGLQSNSFYFQLLLLHFITSYFSSPVFNFYSHVPLLCLHRPCSPDYLSKWGNKSLGGSIVTHGAYIDSAVYKWTRRGTQSFRQI